MITTCVILAAGKGERMRSLTKGSSKEMLQIKDRPVISYAISEAREAGCSNIIVITNPEKKDLINYLTDQKGEHASLQVKEINSRSFMESLGAAIDVVGDDAFALLLPDMFVAKTNALKKVISTFVETRNPAIGIFEDKKWFGKGYYITVQHLGDQLYQVNSFTSSGSKMRVFGRYAFPKEMGDYVKRLQGEDSEKGLLELIIRERGLNGFFFKDGICDLGVPESYFLAKGLMERGYES